MTEERSSPSRRVTVEKCRGTVHGKEQQGWMTVGAGLQTESKPKVFCKDYPSKVAILRRYSSRRNSMECESDLQVCAE